MWLRYNGTEDRNYAIVGGVSTEDIVQVDDAIGEILKANEPANWTEVIAPDSHEGERKSLNKVQSVVPSSTDPPVMEESERSTYGSGNA